MWWRVTLRRRMRGTRTSLGPKVCLFANIANNMLRVVLDVSEALHETRIMTVFGEWINEDGTSKPRGEKELCDVAGIMTAPLTKSNLHRIHVLVRVANVAQKQGRCVGLAKVEPHQNQIHGGLEVGREPRQVLLKITDEIVTQQGKERTCIWLPRKRSSRNGPLAEHALQTTVSTCKNGHGNMALMRMSSYLQPPTVQLSETRSKEYRVGEDDRGGRKAPHEVQVRWTEVAAAAVQDMTPTWVLFASRNMHWGCGELICEDGTSKQCRERMQGRLLARHQKGKKTLWWKMPYKSSLNASGARGKIFTSHRQELTSPRYPQKDRLKTFDATVTPSLPMHQERGWWRKKWSRSPDNVTTDDEDDEKDTSNMKVAQLRTSRGSTSPPTSISTTPTANMETTRLSTTTTSTSTKKAATTQTATRVSTKSHDEIPKRQSRRRESRVDHKTMAIVGSRRNHDPQAETSWRYHPDSWTKLASYWNPAISTRPAKRCERRRQHPFALKQIERKQQRSHDRSNGDNSDLTSDVTWLTAAEDRLKWDVVKKRLRKQQTLRTSTAHDLLTTITTTQPRTHDPTTGTTRTTPTTTAIRHWYLSSSRHLNLFNTGATTSIARSSRSE